MSAENGSRLVDVIFPGGGACGALLRAKDWSTTPLGPVEQWPQSLRTTVSIILGATTPVLVFWGPERVQLYNDAYRPMLGSEKHPAALGRAGRETWAEIYDLVGPQIDSVFAGGTVDVRDGQLMLERNGFVEECFFDWSYSPIRDERGAIAGVYNTCAETTSRVLSDRRLALVRELSLHTSTDTRVSDVLRTACTLLGHAPADVPFALIYAIDDDGSASRVCCAGIADDTAASPCTIRRDDPRSWNVFDVDGLRVVDDVRERFGDVLGALWPEPVTKAIIVPLPGAGCDRVLVVGMSPRLVDDAAYRDFLQLLGRQLAASLAVTHALEQEQQRTAALAALDREKTTFFSTISHEFRTPLTLLLAPVEDALADVTLDDAGRERLELVHRNARRLQKLVNTLLEVARIDAGRATASYTATDVAALTAELASGFRSAIERAGLRLDVEIGSDPIEAFVDRDLWEKIVLNLLSNALKFTFDGGVRVDVTGGPEGVRVVVEDSGVGIPADEVPRLFRRFHRVSGTRSRTGEGSGIGLALVHDLVALHGGTIDVDSVVGRGTRFTISVPAGSAHLDPATITMSPATTATNLDAFVTEALGWMGVAAQRRDDDTKAGHVGDAHILVVDDNADMRGFIARLLAEHWEVDVANDGVEALAAIRAKRPDLVISDVMMPNLDGFGLLAAVRADEALAELPVVLVSARAGEDAHTEAIGAGADDYLVKPFVARELVARIRARLDVARLRTAIAVEQRFLHELFANAPASITVLSGADHVVEMTNLPAKAMLGDRPLVGLPVREALPELSGQGWFACLDDVYLTGETRVHHAARVMVGHPILHERFLDLVQQPRRDADGVVVGIVTFGFDVTERVRAVQQLEHESKSKDEFLAMLGHELRNPLAPVLSAVELARSASDRQRLLHHLDVVERQTLNLTSIVDDLLDVSRITSGLITLKREPVDVVDVARSAIGVTAEIVERKRHTLTTTLPNEPVFVVGDAVRLEQVIVNLLTNSAKYTDDGGQLTLVVERQHRDGGDVVIVTLADNGVGIDAGTLPHVFDLFQQAERGLDRALGGLGIGLTIVKRLVELHGGTITASSPGPGRGSTFSFGLPVVTTTTTTAKATTSSTPRGLSVLVVDDNVDAAEALAELLSMWDHDVRVAFDGTSALSAAVATAAPDLIILDIGLPDIDGFEVARRLREIPALASTKLVALTGYGQLHDKQRSAAVGFDEHLVKPLSPTTLQALLQRQR